MCKPLNLVVQLSPWVSVALHSVLELLECLGHPTGRPVGESLGHPQTCAKHHSIEVVSVAPTVFEQHVQQVTIHCLQLLFVPCFGQLVLWLILCKSLRTPIAFLVT